MVYKKKILKKKKKPQLIKRELQETQIVFMEKERGKPCWGNGRRKALRHMRRNV